MQEFLQRVENAVTTRCLLSRGQKILVAVSGGADSMALLHALHSLAKKNRWKISVAHFNHRLRGRASAADEKLVRVTANQLRLKFFGGGADVKAFAASRKISIEMAARKLRHEFLARTARGQKIPSIALAHHADDQVELFFLRLLRGAGGEGLAGMKWHSVSPADRKISLVRPLLDFSKVELLEFASENKIRFREDETNSSIDFLRNRIRQQLLPLLRQNYQPAINKTVLRVMDIVGAEAEATSEAAQKWAGEKKGRTGFADLPVAIQRKVLQRQLTGLDLWPDFELVEQLRKMPDQFVDVSSSRSVTRDVAGKVSVRNHLAGEFNPSELELDLSGKMGADNFGGRFFVWRIDLAKAFQTSLGKSARGLPTTKQKMELFDAEKIGGKIVLRHWRAGDRLQPIGMKSAVKLQDLFVNAKIPAARRRELVLATTAGGEIFWVEGLRIGEPFKLTPETRSTFIWKWSQIGG